MLFLRLNFAMCQASTLLTSPLCATISKQGRQLTSKILISNNRNWQKKFHILVNSRFFIEKFVHEHFSLLLVTWPSRKILYEKFMRQMAVFTEMFLFPFTSPHLAYLSIQFKILHSLCRRYCRRIAISWCNERYFTGPKYRCFWWKNFCRCQKAAQEICWKVVYKGQWGHLRMQPVLVCVSRFTKAV